MSKKFVSSIPIPEVMRDQGARYFDLVLACDADGVLVDFDSRVQKHATESLLRGNHHFKLKESRTYYYHRDPKTQLSKEQMGRLFRELMGRTKGGIGDLDFYEGAVDAIRKARKKGIEARVLTNLPGALDASPDAGQSYNWGTARQQRIQQFVKAGVVLEEDHVIFCEAHDKANVMLDKILLHIPLLVDDRASTLVSARADHGLIAVGIESSRTLKLPKGKGLIDRYGVVWFNSLQDAMPAIIEVFAELQELGLVRVYSK
ncbi:hypothetical protein BH10CYA1_BH10CYA1_53430 [soil metagenome]